VGHSRGFRQKRVAARRRTAWDNGPGGTSAEVISTSIRAIVGLGVSPNLDGITFARIRGVLDLLLTSTSVAAGGFSGAFGIGIATLTAFTDIGVTAIPTPITQQSWEGWLYWKAFSVLSATATIADGANASAIHRSIEVDTKAMRKAGEEMIVYSVIETVEVGVAVMQVSFNSRALVFMP